MKKILLFLISFVFLSSAVAMAGQGCCAKCNKANSEKYIQQKMEKLKKTLALEDSQLAQVESILRAKMESKQAIHDRMQQEMNAVSETFQANMNQILNADQQVALQSMMDKYKEQKKCKKKKRFLLF